MKTVPNLTGVPETMLWTLYNRASEAKRSDRVLDDPESIRIFDSLDYDFPRSFGDPDAAHAVRALECDKLLRAWLARHPGGTVVSLGEGLDSQALRVDDGKVRWLTVDLPDAIAVRKRFIPENERRKHLAKSALDHSWMDAVDPSRGVFVVAQGLFMYFQEKQVRSLIGKIAERFRGSELFFDAISRFFSRQTMRGAKRTPHYTLPQMPWGINVDEIEPYLKICAPRGVDVSIINYEIPRGWLRFLTGIMRSFPRMAKMLPVMVHARFQS